MTLLSCLAIGVAFVLALALLIIAGVLLGWVLPRLVERWRAERGGRPPHAR
jgi:hypothetical protein